MALRSPPPRGPTQRQHELRFAMPPNVSLTIAQALQRANQLEGEGRPRDAATVYHSLARAQYAQGDQAAARAAIARAIELDDSLALAHYDFGVMCHFAGDHGAALIHYRRAVTLAPDLIAAWRNLGDCLAAQFDFHDALVAFDEALAREPRNADIWVQRGLALAGLGDNGHAETSYRKAIEVDADHAIAHNNLGAMLVDQGREQEARPLLERALALRGDYAEAWVNLGHANASLGARPEALRCYRKALSFRPDFLAALDDVVRESQYLCEWGELREFQQRLAYGVEHSAQLISPFTPLATPGLGPMQLTVSRRSSEAVERSLKQTRVRMNLRHVRGERKQLRIAYLSGDFHENAMPYLIAAWFEQHDRESVWAAAYSYGPNADSPMRRRLQGAFDAFYDLRNVSAAAIAQRIHDDRIDIAVDLKGYTHRSRSEVLALRPAPIQLHCTGFPGTMGAPWLDYLVADKTVIPPEETSQYSERIVYLPGYYLLGGSGTPTEAAPTRAACSLPENAFVFCDFNQLYKIQPETFDRWMHILRAVPDSILWLLDDHPLAAENLRREADARGVAGARLVFAPKVPHATHFARIGHADLVLDTLPYNGHTTSCEALRAGVPVITLTGDTFAGRVATSLLKASGLGELVTDSAEDFRALAVRLATDPSALRGLKEKVARHRHTSPAFDARRFARNMECAYRMMWSRYELGLPPAHLDVPDQ
jgi:predicted O-linked N-acetylglucosamine transferase (SPINDLY family)